MQKDHQVQKAKDLEASIKRMTLETETLESEVKALKQDKAAVESELGRANGRLQAIQAELPQKLQQLKLLSQQEQEMEAQYMKMLEATPTLIQVMK
eukprot:CAMPEP_0197635808 /NCGR_PEP_ID=MMETSP1338-20131121/11517_1 /TAXON_ID=43686 ORGANISM="Pelagodinium beii, Strain RCC1491" /NCGR_SAMPLE_ID=MMETSP1338 /ASSEMBLY_ACC=CAM_ASM_000754 /LENGTH=95 /DNA_ID=CAMNT_0043207933 /DNA_START=90 /DNA_END=374 /DNA_ORIENTATION=-